MLDISFIDKEEILQRLFPLAFKIPEMNGMPSLSLSDSSHGEAYFVDVTDSIRICCKFWVDDKKSPSILYFHGNDEDALKQSHLATWCMQNGINLFVADYRGYGISDGAPTMTSLFQDCHVIFEYFKKTLKKEKYNPDIFVMGRSLGSMPAIEVAFAHQNDIKGLIVESGTGQNFNSLWKNSDPASVQNLTGTKFYNKDKIQDITIPTLFIHGDQDKLIPYQIGEMLYQLSGAKTKIIVLIPGAGHNDLIDIGDEDYFTALKQFVKKKTRKPASKTSRTKTTKTQTGKSKSSSTKTKRSKSSSD